MIGDKIRQEMFGSEPALGQLVRVGDLRVRVVGILKPVGQGLGMNTDEVVFVPVALAQALFNSNTLFRILVEAKSREAIPDAKEQVLEIIKAKKDDINAVSEDAAVRVIAGTARSMGIEVVE